MLGWRLLAAAVILIPLVLLCWLDDRSNFGRPGIWLVPLAALVTVVAVMEMSGLLQSSRYRPPLGAVLAGALLVVVSAAVPLAWPEVAAIGPLARLGLTFLAVVLALGLVLAAEMWRFDEPGRSVPQVGVGLFVILYLGLPMAFLVHLRMLYANRWGLVALVSILFVVKISDTGAYFFGRWLGRRPMARRLSPKKTVAGAIGGCVAACVAAWFYFHFMIPWLTDQPQPSGRSWEWIAYGAALAIAGMFGDLSESLIKRDVQQKDSAQWLPGLGGVLDVIDSLLAAAPVGYVWWAWGGLGP